MILFKVLVLISCFTFGTAQTDPLFSDEVEKLLSRLDDTVEDKIGGYKKFPIPETFDARENWPKCEIIQWIRNQWICECACFVFAVVSMISDRVCIATHGINQTELSANEAMACCDECVLRSDDQHPKYQQCLEIDYFTAPMKDFVRFGLASGADYNTTRDQGCMDVIHDHIDEVYSCVSYCSSGYRKARSRFQDWKHFPGSSTEKLLIRNFSDTIEIQREIKVAGPVAAVLFVDDEFRNYKGGVYKGVTKVNLSDVVAVKILGWGIENKVPYWLAANTMGPDWGDKGFLKIVRDARVVRFFAAVYIPFQRIRTTTEPYDWFDNDDDRRRKNDNDVEAEDEKNKDDEDKTHSSHSQALENYIVLIVVSLYCYFYLVE